MGVDFFGVVVYNELWEKSLTCSAKLAFGVEIIMKKSKIVAIIDILAYLINDLLAWAIIIWFEATGYDCKFQNLTIHYLIVLIGVVHIFLSIFLDVFFHKKERTKYCIKIGNKLFIYNLVMTVIPYILHLFIDIY